MDFELKTLSPLQCASTLADALLLLWPDSADQTVTVGDPLGLWARGAVLDGDIEAGAGQCLVAHRLPGVKPRRVVLVRSGDGKPASVRKAVLTGMAALKSASCKSLTLVAHGVAPAALGAAVQAVAEASYVYVSTKPQAKPRSWRQVTLAVDDAAALRSTFARACAMVRGVELAKEWANRPGNHATPSHLADAARELAKAPRMSVEVLGPKEVGKLGMGAFLAVAQGSEQPLRFIELRYQGAAKSSAPVVLVGKGITFDTGGVCLKPAPEMDEMKFDMGGAASVLGVFAALAELQPAINVVGLIPSCENMPDGRAVKPGDVVTSMSGQTIEILNTDAEGRLVLCDALTYAARFKPRALIDIATLTGACVIALGGVRCGLFANNDVLAAALLDAGQAALDPGWRMPLDEEYEDGLKSSFADVANVGGRQAGVVTAAKFLQKFVGEHTWAHLDIAGVAWKSGAAKGSTGRPVPMLLQYLLDEADRLSVVAPGAQRGPVAKSKAGAASSKGNVGQINVKSKSQVGSVGKSRRAKG